jgi:uncharacterized protein YbaR (Trm112 family)
VREINLDSKLLDILVCPLCKGPLTWHPRAQQLVCRGERLAFPVRDDVPALLEEEARKLSGDDPLLAE